MSNDNITDQEHIEPCPFCGAILYPINSQSTKMECLQKACGYSTVKSYPNLMKDRPFNIVTEAEIKERVRIANERVTVARGKCWHKDISVVEGAWPRLWGCDKCGLTAMGTEGVRQRRSNYASGPTKFLVLLNEIRTKGYRIIIDTLGDNCYLEICKVRDFLPKISHIIIAPTLALAVTEAWIELDKETKKVKEIT